MMLPYLLLFQNTDQISSLAAHIRKEYPEVVLTTCTEDLWEHYKLHKRTD